MQFPLFLIPIAVGLLAQFSKRFFNRQWLSNITVQGIKLPRYGGMPSTHTAFAFSLATVVVMVDGIASASFAIVAAMTIFILDDALRMRLFLGRHGEALRRMIQKLPIQEQAAYPALEARLGHKPSEVVVGALIGVILTIMMMIALSVG